MMRRKLLVIFKKQEINKNNLKSEMNNIVEKIKQKFPWIPADILDTKSIPKGDMPGDKIEIGPQHIRKARIIFPKLLGLLISALEENLYQRAVVVVCGGSGVGKSEIASLISYYLNRKGLGSYTLSGDNYPHRVPKYNNAERRRVFRKSGIDGLILHGQYFDERPTLLMELQESGNDSNPDYTNHYPWLSVYQNTGRNGLKNYLGTTNEIDFKELTEIISRFKNGESKIFLKRMGREESELWYDPVDFSNKNVMIIEWTHGNNDNLQGIDIPILLHSTPQETLEHRRSRNRDGATDSPFTTMVLEIEQDMLVSQAPKAKMIVSKNGEIIDYSDFVKLIVQGQK
jgi:alpha-galactosidase